MTATYRVQLHRGFTFSDAQAQVPYLADLGITTLYLSPVLQAVRGSLHGYDVVDHTRVNEELGGVDALRRLADAAHERSLSVIVDVVPNHVAFTAPEQDNPVLWRMLREGPASEAASWFDVDWDAGNGRIAVPVLGAEPKLEVAEGALRLDVLGGEPVIRYHDHVFPVAEGSLRDDIEDTLARQHYELFDWRETEQVLNYRRFFAITSLIAVRVELPHVFEESHRLLLDLNHEGVVDGFRIDHPDGLADPGEYLRRLRSQCRPGTTVHVEKILEGEEHLPLTWPVEGTTGYDAARAIDLALADPTTLPTLDRTWAATGGPPDLEAVLDEAKRLVVTTILRPEVARLVRRAQEALPDADPDDLAVAVTELLVACSVYRGYADSGPDYVSTVAGAVGRARETRPDVAGVLHMLESLCLEPRDDSGRDFAVRLQQTWSAVMAKAVEDTAFYRHYRLAALNEVGGDPAALPTAGPDTFHRWASHQQHHWPLGLTALSTHDTKRSEDVRARMLAVAADDDAWQHGSAAFARAADQARVDRPTGHLLWQTLVGLDTATPDRLRDYLVKAVREAALHTTWTAPDEHYEQRVSALADRALADSALRDVVRAAVEANSERIRSAVLAQKALQLLAPGVPDVYQGCELVACALVDPDNRRPVDYEQRQSRLARLRTEPPQDLDDEKLLLTVTVLALRQEVPEAFGIHAHYAPLEVGGIAHDAEPPALGFVRGGRVACVVTRCVHRGAWMTERVELPEGVWRDRLTGHVISRSPAVVPCAELFESYPVAVLVREV